DVEARVELVEHGDLGLEDDELDGLVAFLLAAGEVDVEGTRKQSSVEADPRRFSRYEGPYDIRRTITRPQRGNQRVLHGHAGHFDRILHCEEKTGLRPLPRGHAQQLHTVERDAAVVDLVLVASHDHMGERRLAR